MGKVTVVGGKVGMEAPYPAFADATWEKVIEACQTNTVPETWEVGDQKAMTINGTDYLIDIIGKNHDIYSDGSGTAPLTFQLHNCYGDGANDYIMNDTQTNVGGWTSCQMRNTTLPTIMELMPSKVQSSIKEVNKLTSAGNKSSTINITADKLFFLSEIEVFGTITHSFSGEGSQYDYYKSGNSPAKNGNWLGRSPKYDATNAFTCVIFGEANFSNAILPRSISFAFCF